MSTYRSLTPSERMLNHLIISIVVAVGGTVTGGDTNTLLQDWLTAIGG